ncbi:MAG: hypothetical protein RIQ47_959 [Bacteroidota bacterium]|jgi:hypothetical protein
MTKYHTSEFGVSFDFKRLLLCLLNSRYSSFLLLILLIVLSSVVLIAQPVSPGPFTVSLTVTNRSLSQSNMSDVLEVAGYRSTDCGTAAPTSSCGLLDNADMSINYPGLKLGFSYAWSKTASTGIDFTTTRNTGNYFASSYSSNPELDYLSWNISLNSADLYTNLVVLKYPRKKQVGLQLSASSGFSVNTLWEELDVRMPADSIQLYNVQSRVERKYGLNALFSFTSELYIGSHFSLIPLQIKWYLPVIRPGYSESVFDNGYARRTLSGRNYNLSGWFGYFGVAAHF